MTTNATKPAANVGPYSPARQAGNLLFVSGQLPIDPATSAIVEGGVKEQTLQVFANLKTLLAKHGYTLDDVVKTNVFLADISFYGEMNDVYAQQFTGAFPARSALAVKGIPKGALVEIEVVAAK